MTAHPDSTAFQVPQYVNHECDSLGYPLCRCEDCKQINITKNAQFVASLFRQITREGTDERLERIEREQDYEQDRGAKFNG